MKPFQSYSPEDIISSNLQELNHRLGILYEQNKAHLQELARLIAEDGIHSDFLSSLPDHRPTLAPPDNAALLPNNVKDIKGVHTFNQSIQIPLLCKELYHLLSQHREFSLSFFFADANEVSKDAFHRIVYQKNSFTDVAYLQFSSILTDARATYAHSFVAACEEVYNGYCEYCILPIENASEGQLQSFYRLIERYELKIALCCKVNSASLDRSTYFALLRRNMLPNFKLEDKAERFEFSIPKTISPAPFEVLTAAELCGLRLHRINSFPEQGSTDGFATHYSFLTNGSELYSFLLYLAMEAPHHTPIGLYTNMN